MKIEKIKSYVAEWNDIEGIKPENDQEFIKNFTEFCKSSTVDKWWFDGENGYCGFTATINEHPPHLSFGRGIGFEFAYGIDFVKVFTDRNEGYWVSEYINLKGGDAAPLIAILHEKLIEWGGFKCNP
jgi:hypothetical protein